MTIGLALCRAATAATVGLFVVAVVASAAQDWPNGLVAVVYGVLAIVFAGVGWIIAERRPGNPIGPLLLLFGFGLATYIPADAYLRMPGPPPGAAVFATGLQSLDLPSFVLISLALALFPDGRPVSPRWRLLFPLSIAVIAIGLAGVWLSADAVILFPQYRSPLAIDGFPSQTMLALGYAGMVLIFILAVVSLILRWRRGSTVERTQIKWIASAAALALVIEMINVLTFDVTDPNGAIAVAASFALTLIPVSIGVAILRYRLYEIDRLISRTIGWAVVTGLLIAVFALLVVGLQAALTGFTQGQTLAVAASTLVAFALFQPLRRWVQRAVDRRFDRARYDAERTAQAFADRLRDETDIRAVTGDLTATATAALAPSGLGVWLREGGA